MSPVPSGYHTVTPYLVVGDAMAAGASSLREPADQPYGDRMAGVEDRFGNQ